MWSTPWLRAVMALNQHKLMPRPPFRLGGCLCLLSPLVLGHVRFPSARYRSTASPGRRPWALQDARVQA